MSRPSPTRQYWVEIPSSNTAVNADVGADIFRGNVPALSAKLNVSDKPAGFEIMVGSSWVPSNLCELGSNRRFLPVALHAVAKTLGLDAVVAAEPPATWQTFEVHTCSTRRYQQKLPERLHSVHSSYSDLTVAHQVPIAVAGRLAGVNAWSLDSLPPRARFHLPKK